MAPPVDLSQLGTVGLIAVVVLVGLQILKDPRLNLLSKVKPEWLPAISMVTTAIAGTAYLVLKGWDPLAALLTSVVGDKLATGLHQLGKQTGRALTGPKDPT